MAREYKDSGIEWIGQIPKEWEVELIGNNIKEINDKNDDSSEDNALQFKMGSIISKKGGDSKYNPESLAAYTKVIEGDIIINGLNLSFDFISQRVGLVKEKGVITSTYLTLRPSSLLHSDFINYLFKAYDNCKAFHGMGRGLRQILAYRELKNQKLIYPLLPEQKKIADYLDKVCGEIDEIVALQETMIEELKAYKQSIITEAVTKGLNPNAPMCNSGIDWVRSLPKKWKVVTPKALFALRKDKAKKGERQLTASQQYGVIYQDEYMSLTGANIVTVMKDFDILKHVEAGDFVISMRSFQGGLEYSENTGSISSAYVMLIPNLKYVYPRFYRWLFKSVCYINALQSTSNMVRDGQAMRYSNFAQVPLYMVPLDEQRVIASYLDTKCSEIDSLIALKQAKIDELKEYKKSVIYEYVTGKKEVS